jgi:uncharacterized SAM-binding protein YcdF (DUF218 family)
MVVTHSYMNNRRLVNNTSFVISALCLIPVILFLLFYTAVLTTLGKFLVVRDQPTYSSCIYLLGGNYETRAPMAAQIYRKGWAPLIVVAREPDSPGGNNPNFTDTTVRILTDAGVPAASIVELHPSGGVTSTADEARAFRAYLDNHPARSVFLVTSDYHTRRTRLTFNRALGDRVRLILIPVHESWFRQQWWRESFSRDQIITEYEKLAYYFFTFWR